MQELGALPREIRLPFSRWRGKVPEGRMGVLACRDPTSSTGPAQAGAGEARGAGNSPQGLRGQPDVVHGQIIRNVNIRDQVSHYSAQRYEV